MIRPAAGRKGARLLLLLSMVFTGMTFAATALTPRPPSGQDVDETRRVALPASLAGPCIAVVKGDAHIVVNRDRLQALADAAAPVFAGGDDTARQVHIAAGRARAILAALSGPTDPRGCVLAGPALASDTDHLLLDLLEQAQAMVVAGPAGRPATEVFVRYLGQRCGPACGQGLILVSLVRGGRPFFSVSWWVA